MNKAVILVSGGLDSATVLAVAKSWDFNCYALSIAYGQRNRVELDASRRVARSLGVMDHRIVDVDLRCFGGSSLTSNLEVPIHGEYDPKVIPNTYVPARNTIMLSYAMAYAEIIGAFDIFYGANMHDYSGYPDCRPEYVEAFQKMANLATKYAVEGKATIQIRAPLLHDSKAQIIRRGLALGVDYGITHSCYDPVGDRACGQCSSCYYRKKGFEEANVPDPTRYAYATGHPNDLVRAAV